MSYWRFAAMIATSTVVMFGLMYLNTYLWGHVFFSETRAYMALLMGATMAIIMLSFMLSMYANKAVNAAIFAGSVVVFALTLWLVRSQATVGDTSYMRAMIPHHSIAIMTSNRANLSDPRVGKLAEAIAGAQNKEIAEMRYLIDDIVANGDRPEGPAATPASIVSLDEALASPMIEKIDAEPMSQDEIAQQFPQGAACRFTYTTDSPPVLATDGDSALIKISGDLVALEQDAEGFGAEGIAVRLGDADGSVLDLGGEGRSRATMILTLDAGLEAGYQGFYGCNG